MDRKNSIELAAKIIGVGMLVFLLFAFIANRLDVKSGGCGIQYPLFDFLFNPNIAFNDCKGVYDQIKNLSPFDGMAKFRNPYPPFGMIVSYPFSVIDRLFGENFAIIVLLVPFVLFYFVTTYNSIKYGENVYGKINDLINTFFLCCSYPVLFMIDRGNFLVLTYIALFFFLKYYNESTIQKRFLGVLSLAIAISLKVYPLLFLLLFLADKRYKDFIYTILIVTFLSIFPLFLYKEPFIFSFIHTLKDILGMEADVWLRNNFSVAASVKYIFNVLNISNHFPLFLKVLNLLMIVILFLVYRVIRIEKKLWKRFLIISCCSLLLPAVVAEYYGFYIYLSLLLFLSEDTFKTRKDIIYLFLCSIFLIPKNYWVLKRDITIQPYIGTLILIIILFFLFRDARTLSKNK